MADSEQLCEFCNSVVDAEAMFVHLMDHLGTKDDRAGGTAQTLAVSGRSSAAPSRDRPAAEYNQIYLDFTEGGRNKGITINSATFSTFWGNTDTKKEQKFWADLTGAVLEMLTPWFDHGWLLDGTFGQAVDYRYERDHGLFGGDTYVGASVRLWRLAR